MIEAEVAWLAGFFDGEGSVSIVKNRKRNTAFINARIGNTCLPALERVKLISGCGAIAEQRHKNPKWRRVWYWTAACQQAAHFLTLVLPYLAIKREQAEIALQFQATVEKGGRSYTQEKSEIREALYWRLRRLNNPSIEIPSHVNLNPNPQLLAALKELALHHYSIYWQLSNIS